jgi:hypothetical protein
VLLVAHLKAGCSLIGGAPFTCTVVEVHKQLPLKYTITNIILILLNTSHIGARSNAVG